MGTWLLLMEFFLFKPLLQKRWFSFLSHPIKLGNFLLIASSFDFLFSVSHRVKRFFYQQYLQLYLILPIGLEGFLHQKSAGFALLSPVRFGGFLPSCKNSFLTIICLSKLTPKKKAIVTPWLEDLRSGDLARDLPRDFILINSVQCAKLARIIIARFVIIKIAILVARRSYHHLVD